MADTKLLYTNLTCAVTTTENDVLLPFHTNTTHNRFLQFPQLCFKLLILRDQGLDVNSNDRVTICEENWSELNSILLPANFSKDKPNNDSIFPFLSKSGYLRKLRKIKMK